MEHFGVSNRLFVRLVLISLRSYGGILNLRANKLVSLPAAIGDLPNLEKLDARWNKLSSLPEWFQRLEQRGCTVYI